MSIQEFEKKVNAKTKSIKHLSPKKSSLNAITKQSSPAEIKLSTRREDIPCPYCPCILHCEVYYERHLRVNLLTNE